MGPLAIAALAGGAYFLYKKMSGPHVINASSAPKAPTGFVNDSLSGLQFGVQQVNTFADGTSMNDVFLMPAGTRIVRFMQTGADPNSRVEIMSPDGTDPTIKASAMRALGIHPKA